MKPLLITLCTYNERENVGLLIPELLDAATEATVLVIDDNSPDGTGQLVQEMSDQDARIQVLHRPQKAGLGAATVAGFQYAIQQQYQYLINLDADLSHQPRYIPDLLNCMQTSDVAIGSRYVSGGGVRGWTWKRHLMSRAINIWARLLLGLRTRDNSGSFRCYRVACLAAVDWERCISSGYAFQEEVLYRCRRIGCRFREVPIIFEDRRFGVTKISWRESISAVVDILRLGWENLRRGRSQQIIPESEIRPAEVDSTPSDCTLPRPPENGELDL